MTERIPLDELNSDQYDALHAELDRLTAELSDYDERAEQQKQRADEAEQHLRNIASGGPRADAVQAEIGEMIRQTHELREQLDRARQELADRDAAESADAAAGSYAGRAERVEQQLTAVADLIADHEGDEWAAHPATTVLRGILDSHDHAIAQPGRWLHVDLTSPDETTANTSALALADHVRAEFPGVGMRISSNAVETDPLTAAEEARLAQTGINTPGCDCGHDGMGESWHGDECPWRRDVLDGTRRQQPARTTPDDPAGT